MMPPVDLTDAEHDELIRFLRAFPLSPRVKMLRAILAKLDPTGLAPEPLPPPKQSARPSGMLAEKRRR